ncbi:MAG: hypothetical protein H6R21_1363 [Proteobacteria bacterium]|nr:hypothetical protein [Pseudomonadota bacterium]
MKEIRILSATGILGSGFREETLKRAMTLKPDFIGADCGSTDPGPHHLGSGEPQFSDAACKRDLRLMLLAARAAKIPVIVGSAMTAGTDAQLERLAGIAREIAREEKLGFKLATIASEQDRNYLKRRLREGRIKPLANAPQFDEAVIDRSSHIVGMCGAEPYIEALANGAEVVIAGRSSDTSIFAAMPVMRGFNPATVWHAAKILECGAACVVQRKYPDCNFAIVTDSGSTFKKAERYTIKLEGAELAGYQSIVLGSVRDPIILRQFDHWLENLIKAARDRIRAVMGDTIDSQYRLDVRQFGRNAAMGVLEPDMSIGHEVGLLFQITAPTQKLATALAKSLSHIAVHYPVPEWTGLITSVAFPYSPAEIDKGASYRFNMNHVVEPDTPLEMFRIGYERV